MFQPPLNPLAEQQVELAGDRLADHRARRLAGMAHRPPALGEPAAGVCLRPARPLDDAVEGDLVEAMRGGMERFRP
ncbi:MAG TPA: hypothetical protein VG936_05590 [Lacunisphaera sp.]|nr:hypothetical protein [Lacunisphaera sp.]